MDGYVVRTDILWYYVIIDFYRKSIFCFRKVLFLIYYDKIRNRAHTHTHTHTHSLSTSMYFYEPLVVVVIKSKSNRLCCPTYKCI